MNITRPIHKEIIQLLRKFDREYFDSNNILFGGGTRIAIELEEYRESVDIDFFCPDTQAYKAVRSQVTSHSLGSLVRDEHELNFLREIRVDRDAVRLFVAAEERPVKIEFIHFENYPLIKDEQRELFPLPFIDKATCFFTKLLANADRHSQREKKDILDLCMMVNLWGGIPQKSWQIACEKYGEEVIKRGLELATKELQSNSRAIKTMAVNDLQILPTMAEKLFGEYLQKLIQEVENY